jgi:class 3 adenylate cyclase
MTLPWVLVGGAAFAIASLLWGLRSKSAQAAGLQRRVESVTRDIERLQHTFGRFAPEEIVERVIASGITTAGERKEVTALFADLVGYTSLSESIEPDVLVGILNGYFERMSAAITNRRGHMSALVGDGMLAMFGALEPDPWQGDSAVHAALAMRAELVGYNEELESRGLPTLAMGVGLHRGTGVAGLVGSRHLMQYTLVGRTINVAARVQDLTRLHDADILVTRELRETLDDRFVLRELAPAELRGIAAPVGIFAVESCGEEVGGQ